MDRGTADRRLHHRYALAAGGGRAPGVGRQRAGADQDSPLNFARRLIAWRRQQPQLTRGDIVFFDAPEPVLALRRDLPGHPSILAVFNLGPDPVSFELAQ